MCLKNLICIFLLETVESYPFAEKKAFGSKVRSDMTSCSFWVHDKASDLVVITEPDIGPG